LSDPYPCELRPATIEDATEIARLNLLFNGCDEPPERYAARLADPGRVDTPLLAFVTGRAVGIANLRLLAPVFYPEPYAELTELFVEEAFRRQGVGRALVHFAEQLARQGGAVELFVLTGNSNLLAQAFYRAIGYQADDIAFHTPL
jgi:GNAT superfamily N-acetyltransferase